MNFFGKKRGENILTIDIGSSSVNYFMVSSNSDGMKEISGTLYSRLPLLEDPDFKHIERYTKNAMKEVAQEMRKKYPGFSPERIFIVVSAPWYSCDVKFIRVSRKEPFTIDEDLMNKLIADETELFFGKAREKFSDVSDSDIEILDKEIMRSVVNGYAIKNPFGKKTSEFGFYIYFSAVKKSFQDNIKEILHHFFGRLEIKIVSEPLVVFNVLSGMADSEEGFVIVDVGGEVTEIYLVRKGILEDVKSFNWGGNLVVRRLASLMKIDIAQALSFFKASEKGDLKESLDEKIMPAVDGVCTQWQTFLSDSLSEMGKSAALPQKLILIGGVAGSDVLKKCANSPDFASFTILGKPFNVSSLLPGNFEGKVSLSGVGRDDRKMTLPLLLALGSMKYAR